MEIPQFSVFVGHEYLRHAGCGWRDYHGLQYHAYHIAVSYELRHAVVLVYSARFSNRKRAENVIDKQESHQQEKEKAEGLDNADEEKGHCSDTERTASAEATSWKISASDVPED